MIRVLIAEDSPTTLELLSQMLDGDPELCVVGAAQNGAEAVELTERLRPDVVVMDIHMPVLDGFGATQRIMIEFPTPIVLVSAFLDLKSVDSSLRALKLGALAVLEKPPSPLAAGFSEARDRFVGTVRAMAQVKVVRRWPSASPAVPLSSEPVQTTSTRLIAIAASTGGPAALLRILSDLPVPLSVPVLIVQHMAPGFMAGLASWLSGGSGLSVRVPLTDEPLLAGIVYLAPDDHHLGLADRRTVRVSREPPCNGFRPSGTALFESVARVYGAAAVGVILTGMGDDGLLGLRALKQSGARIVAQDEASSVVFGMPAAAIAEGLPDHTLPLELIGPRLGAWLGTTSPLVVRKG